LVWLDVDDFTTEELCELGAGSGDRFGTGEPAGATDAGVDDELFALLATTNRPDECTGVGVGVGTSPGVGVGVGVGAGVGPGVGTGIGVGPGVGFGPGVGGVGPGVGDGDGVGVGAGDGGVEADAVMNTKSPDELRMPPSDTECARK
jgi:hypothetical protein